MKNPPRIPPIFIWVLCGVLTLGAGLYFRLYPLYHNVSSDAYEKSTLIVLSRIRASVTEQVERNYPDMPDAQKQHLIQNMFNKVIREDNARVRKAFEDLGLQILHTSPEKKHYLLESDSYYFLNLTENILEKGDVSSQIKGSKYFNELMLAPLGYWEPQTWHPYLGAWTCRIIRLFDPKADTAYAAGFTSVFLLPFVIAAFFFACRGLGISWLPGLVAAVFFVLAEIYLKRSTYGWYDNDSYNVLFPLLATGCLFRVFTDLANKKKALFWGVLCAASLSLYTKFWYGWSFLWILIMASLCAILVKRLLFKEPQRKETFQISAAILLAGMIGILVMYGPQEIVRIIAFAWGELQKFTRPSFSGWPDLFIVVGELKHATLAEIIRFIGGPLVFLGALGALLLALLRLIKRQPVSDALTALALFFSVTLFLSFGAQRFTILLLTPAVLLFAVFLEDVWSLRKTLQFKKPLTALLAGILLASTALPLMTSQKTIRSLLSPIFNSTWERALVQLREKTPEDSVIVNWWSPGHFIKGVARRKVIFDGASIRGDIGYWLTRVYLSQTEEEALGILRMMTTSSNTAAEYLEKKGLPLSRAVMILTQALRLDKTQAHTFYAQTLSSEMADDLIAMTHNAPPPSYMLVYNENVEGNVLLAYLGKWDFKRIEQLNSDPATLKKIPSKSSKDYIDFLWGLVGGPFRQSPSFSPIARKGTTMIYPEGITIETQNMSATVDSPQYGRGIPQSIFYLDGSNIREKKQANATLSYSVILYKTGDETPRCVLMEGVLANSLLMKMYYFEGKGLKHFRPLVREHDLTGRTKIHIYEILWPASFRK